MWWQVGSGAFHKLPIQSGSSRIADSGISPIRGSGPSQRSSFSISSGWLIAIKYLILKWRVGCCPRVSGHRLTLDKSYSSVTSTVPENTPCLFVQFFFSVYPRYTQWLEEMPCIDYYNSLFIFMVKFALFVQQEITEQLKLQKDHTMWKSQLFENDFHFDIKRSTEAVFLLSTSTDKYFRKFVGSLWDFTITCSWEFVSLNGKISSDFFRLHQA